MQKQLLCASKAPVLPKIAHWTQRCTAKTHVCVFVDKKEGSLCNTWKNRNHLSFP